MNDLIELGWGPFFENQLNDDDRINFRPGRVTEEQKGAYWITTSAGELRAEVSGRMRHLAVGRAEFPAVGDWVLARVQGEESPGIIQRVLERKSKFSRRAAGTETVEQIVATNIDTVFVASSLNQDLNARRLERYLALVWEAQALPVVLLTKSDLCAEPERLVAELRARIPHIEVQAVSAREGRGLELIQPHLGPGKTIAIMGSSGVGKSSLVNWLAGESLLEVKELRAGVEKGRHTTTHRQMVKLASGAMIIDTPGMRELQIWSGEDGVAALFDELDELTRRCRFANCAHATEPGCALLHAVRTGLIEEERFKSFQKLSRESARAESKQERQRASIERRRKKTPMRKRFDRREAWQEVDGDE